MKDFYYPEVILCEKNYKFPKKKMLYGQNSKGKIAYKRCECGGRKTEKQRWSIMHRLTLA